MPAPAPNTKRSFHKSSRSKLKKRKIDHAQPFEGTTEQVLRYEVSELLKGLGREQADPNEHSEALSKDTDPFSTPSQKVPERLAELDLKVVKLSSTGDALATSDDYPGRIFVVPFSLPGEIVRAKVVTSDYHENYDTADFIKVIKPSEARRDDLVGCQYFGQCSGCQLQMMTYEDQLNHKKGIVEQAYRAFSNLKPELVPTVADTLPSPMQYGYRTKLTPHFDGVEMRAVDGVKKFLQPPILGFGIKGRKKVMEIEDCPIGTDIVREGLKRERSLLNQNFSQLKNGATILLRESTKRIPKSPIPQSPGPTTNGAENNNSSLATASNPNYTAEKTCISDMNATATEYIDDYQFESRAGSFFQNNNSILSSFTAYVRDHAVPSILPSSSSSSDSTSSSPPIKYLLDAYCGSGLFTITLSSLFVSSLGVDVDPAGIRFARLNAKANKVHNTGFIDADATKLFLDVPFPADQTVVVIDPPRKGCSEGFLKQLLEFGPKRVVYVSCNVNTQARDVGMLVRGRVDGFHTVLHREGNDMEATDDGKDVGARYKIESLKGCDFFPQTGHVEGVAVLSRL